jgi:hypothetical protein
MRWYERPHDGAHATVVIAKGVLVLVLVVAGAAVPLGVVSPAVCGPMGVVLPPALGSSVVGGRPEMGVGMGVGMDADAGAGAGAGVGCGCGSRIKMAAGRREAVSWITCVCGDQLV